jgi:DNA modification methylase
LKTKQQTEFGEYFIGDATKLLEYDNVTKNLGKVQLILTSPPFPLNNKKKYGNLTGNEYKSWFSSLAPVFSKLLKNDGSIVIELGNAWVAGRPIQSLLNIEAILEFLKNSDTDLRLCQQFICYNPARLPSPAQWVTIKKCRVTDSYTTIWWLSKNDFPKANTNNILRPYSRSMRQLLKRKKYNAGKRPSEHIISKAGFLDDHGGSIPHNFLELEQLDEDRIPRLPNAFGFSNTESSSFFLKTCRERGISPHPSRMPEGLAAFFINFLTEPGDLVLDPFSGSNTTGFVAECLARRWISLEILNEYLEQSIIRFQDPILEEYKRKDKENGNNKNS